MDVTATAAGGESSGPPHAALIAACVGSAAVIWFVLLSGWLGVAPGSVIVKRQNVLFNSDTNVWIDETVNHHRPSTIAIHPLTVPLWRPPSEALVHLCQVFLPPERARLFAARLLVALVAGTGVGCLALLALHVGISLTQGLLLFSTYLLFTASATISLPEHFGISNGLLSIAFVIPIVVANPRLRTAVLAALVPLCGGTTVTNVLYPLASLYRYSVKSARTKRAIWTAGALAAAAAIFLYKDSQQVAVFSQTGILPGYFPSLTRWYLKSTMIHIYVDGYLNLRLLRHPLSAIVYVVYMLVAPAVGPSPLVRRFPGRDVVTYEPSHQLLHLSYYWGPQAVGAILWAALLVSCTCYAIRDRRTRNLVVLPIGWILFNVVFHNLWGDELVLYAPHWSWALMALVLLGARHLSRMVTVSIVVPVLACQIYTLILIKRALLTIVW
jgi:hypothetical protein